MQQIIHIIAEMANTKPMWAVVQFVHDDESFCEVPSNWIEPKENSKSNEATCWWPRSKNVTTTIERRTDPNKQLWESFEVVITKYCCK